jgi:hypothetical protein
MIHSVPRAAGAVIPDLVVSDPLPIEVLAAALIFAIVSGGWLVWRALGATTPLRSALSDSRRIGDLARFRGPRARQPSQRPAMRRRPRVDPNRGRAFLR